MRSFSTLLSIFLLFSAVPVVRAETASDFDLASVDQLFPHKGLESRIAFWRMVYAEYDRRSVVFHDRENLAIVYKVLSFDRLPEVSEEERIKQRNKVEEEATKIENALKDLATYGVEAAGSSSTHKDVYKALMKARAPIDSSSLLAAMARVRDQRGVKDRFEAGVIRSGLYLPYIKSTFVEKGLPEELAYLPHVESSFDYASYSKVGAAGIWQFMRGTARGLLTLNSLMDERRDPIRATEAAAALLLKNYRLLGSWPLAITAYNHGTNGMLRARAAFGEDYLSILDKYESKYFGFASKNFYSEFLAALDCAKNYRRYFPLAKMAEPLRFARLTVKNGSRKEQQAAIDRVSEGTLRAYNPGLSVDIHRSFGKLPAGYTLRLPDGEARQMLATLSPEGQRWIARAAPVGGIKKNKVHARNYRVSHKVRHLKSRRAHVAAKSRHPSRRHIARTDKRTTSRNGKVAVGG
ncbi:MAG TPA: transglycosylase SLT domain-containing protein [Acidobacteriota bacterium]|jgi:membrane-bound lytic murein transglycosylase D|nr:transglycosylase SLT domain-containing protein [Acidobacteriota bacterium]